MIVRMLAGLASLIVGGSPYTKRENTRAFEVASWLFRRFVPGESVEGLAALVWHNGFHELCLETEEAMMLTGQSLMRPYGSPFVPLMSDDRRELVLDQQEQLAIPYRSVLDIPRPLVEEGQPPVLFEVPIELILRSFSRLENGRLSFRRHVAYHVEVYSFHFEQRVITESLCESFFHDLTGWYPSGSCTADEWEQAAALRGDESSH